MGHLFYEEGNFLTLCKCTPTNNKSLFPIICHAVLHFLFLYYNFSILKLYLYLNCSSIMETLKVHSRPFKKLPWWISLRFFDNFIINMRIVNTLCISKKKALCHYVNINVKVFVETFKITLDGGIFNAN